MFVTALPQILQIAKPPPLWKNVEKCSGSFSPSFISNPVRKKKHQCHILWLLILAKEFNNLKSINYIKRIKDIPFNLLQLSTNIKITAENPSL